MPYTIRKTKSGYRVTSSHAVKAKATTKTKAKRQVRLLQGVKHGWKPTGKRARS